MDKDNGLIKKDESIIKKVINFFRKTFWKKNFNNEIQKEVAFENEKEVLSNKDLNVPKENTSLNILLSQSELEKSLKSEEELIEEVDIEYEPWDEELYQEQLSHKVIFNDSSDVDLELEKRRILELYKNIKESKDSIDSIDELDLMIINKLLKEEIKLKSKIIKKQILVKKNS